MPTSPLYDALQRFEAPRALRKPYPVHKRLRREVLGCEDIYEWILEHAPLPGDARVLDAGCGVGFGTMKIARAGARFVTGISLSRVEIDTARRLLRGTDLEDRVSYEHRSFDDVPRARYDLVVAVESLKHSPDLARTLDGLVDSLNPGGRLVIVEDFHAGSVDGEAAQRLAESWALTRLYTQADYCAALGPHDIVPVDLTRARRRTGPMGRFVRLAVLRSALALPTRMSAGAWRAFRGGLYLEELYESGAMTYGALFFPKSPSIAP